MQRCPNCATLNPAEARYCMRCGTSLANGSLPEGSGQTAPLDGERRVVTILFADVVGSTALAEDMDPEEWTRVMNGAYEALLPAIRANGGTVGRLMGDGLLAFFGAPVAHEDDPLRAVQAAQELLTSARSYAGRIKAARNVEFAVRVGVNTGPVLVGTVGGAPMHEYTAMGDAVNVAARLQSLAEPNSVLVAENTHSLVAPYVVVHDRGWFTVKGKTRKVRAYRLLSIRPRQEREERLEHLRSPLVGRERERAALRACLDEALGGRGLVVSITGETGIGKSRLMEELRAEARQRQVLWLEGRAAAVGQGISYWPFREMLRQAAGMGSEADENRSWERLTEAVGELFPHDGDSASADPQGDGTPKAEEILPYLAALLALKTEGEQAERIRYLDAEALRRQVFLAARRFFGRLASRQVTVLALEDLHRDDESSLRLLEYLLPLVDSAPVLFCVTARLEAGTTASTLLQEAAERYGQRYRELRLSSLPDSQSAVLLGNLLGASDLPGPLQQLIIAKSSGNPHFMEEVLRSLIDSGGITRASGTGEWRAAGSIGSLAIPNTIQGLVAARLDRLDEETRRVLRVASVIGRSFHRQVLEAVAGSAGGADSLRTHLEALEQSALIERKGAGSGAEYAFKHTLVQEITYNGILIAQRRALHASVAQAVERLFPERLGELAGLLAYHYARAEAWDKAHDYLVRAGDQAGRMAADDEALVLYEQALEAYARAFPDRWEPVQRARLERKIGEALFRRGHNEQALGNLRRALAVLGQSLPETARQVRREIAGELLLQGLHRLFPRMLARGSVGPDDPVVEEVIRIYRVVGWIDTYTNLRRLFYLTLKGLNYSQARGYGLGASQSGSALGYALDVLGAYRSARHYHERAVALAERTGHAATIGLAYLTLGHHDYCAGQLPAATAHCSTAARAYRQVGDLHGWGSATQIVAYALTYQGRLADATRAAEELVHRGKDGDEPQVQGWGLSALGAAEWRLGRLELAAGHLKEGVQLLDAVPDRLRMVRARIELGRCHLRQNRMKDAIAELEEAGRICTTYSLKGIPVAPLEGAQAEGYLAAAALSGDREQVPWLRKAAAACKGALRRGRRLPLVLPEAMRMKAGLEWQRGRTAAAAIWWRRSLQKAEALGERLCAAIALLEMGRALGSVSSLRKAARLLGECGAEGDLAEAQRCLAALGASSDAGAARIPPASVPAGSHRRSGTPMPRAARHRGAARRGGLP